MKSSRSRAQTRSWEARPRQKIPRVPVRRTHPCKLHKRRPSSTAKKLLLRLQKECHCSKPRATKFTPAAASIPARLKSTRSTRMSFTWSTVRPLWSQAGKQSTRKRLRLTRSAEPGLKAAKSITLLKVTRSSFPTASHINSRQLPANCTTSFVNRPRSLPQLNFHSSNSTQEEHLVI